MVLAERSELMRNGSSSASASNSNPPATETSSDDDNSIKQRNGKSKTKQSEYEEKIRVGRDYQAVCPPLIPEVERKPEVLNDRALLVWSPTKEIPDTKLEEYISVAKEKYGYNGEQALGMLFWHKHDLERAVMDLANFTPFPDEWTFEDKVLFEQAFQFHGKSFHRIRQMMPDKSIASLVKYYYSWKKTRHRQSVMDRQEKSKANKEGSENGSDNGSNEESDNDDKDQTLTTAPGIQEQSSQNSKTVGSEKISKLPSNNNDVADFESSISAAVVNKQRQQTPPNSNADSSSTGGRITPTANSTSAGGCCTNCGVPCNVLNASPHGKLCFSCHHHWRRTGNKRPTSGPYFGKRLRNSERHKRKPPRGMYINHDDIVALASSNDKQDELLANTDREIVSLLSQVQHNKQNISSKKVKHSEQVESRVADNNRINARWTNEELMLAVQGVRKYGKDFQSIAEILGTKTEAHVRTFFINYRRRYNLDQVLKQYDSEREPLISTETGTDGSISKKMELKSKKESNDLAVVDESDNTTSSETNISKATNLNSNDETKSNTDNVVMEIDLDMDNVETQVANRSGTFQEFGQPTTTV